MEILGVSIRVLGTVNKEVGGLPWDRFLYPSVIRGRMRKSILHNTTTYSLLWQLAFIAFFGGRPGLRGRS